MPFDVGSSALVTTDFSAADAAELALMVKWVRGQDTQNENNFQVGSANTDVRASIHGDVLHSRPVVLNYGTPSTSDNVYVFYGGNDGVLRAIKGGQATTDGTEQWAFIAPEFFGKLKRQYSNSPQVLYPSTAASSITPTPIKRDYFFDGPITSYVERDTSGNVTKAYLYLGMRRGGRFIYALDVTSPTNPKFLWKKTSTDSGFTELGQTWSQPAVAKIRGGTDPGVGLRCRIRRRSRGYGASCCHRFDGPRDLRAGRDHWDAPLGRRQGDELRQSSERHGIQVGSGNGFQRRRRRARV